MPICLRRAEDKIVMGKQEDVYTFVQYNSSM